MSKRNLLNLALLIFVLILVTFIIYEPGKSKPVTPTKLTDLKVSDIHHIIINRQSIDSSEQNIVFEKTEAGWFMLEPYKLAANTFRIESILKLLSTVSYSQNNLKNLEQKTFGLDKPQITITFNKNKRVIFGHNKSLKNHRYVKIDSTLHMIADTFQYQLAAKVESYINHKILPEKSKIIKLDLPDLKLQQTEGKWHVSPKADSFSADSVNQLISEWQLSQAYDINKTKPTSKSKADVIVHLDNKKILQFKIETNKDKFNLVNIDSGIRYILSADRKNKLLKLSNIEQND